MAQTTNYCPAGELVENTSVRYPNVYVTFYKGASGGTPVGNQSNTVSSITPEYGVYHRAKSNIDFSTNSNRLTLYAFDFDPEPGDQFHIDLWIGYGAFSLSTIPGFSWILPGAGGTMTGGTWPAVLPTPENDFVPTRNRWTYTADGTEGGTLVAFELYRDSNAFSMWRVYGAMVTPVDDPDVGRFNGDTPDTEEITYTWTGDPGQSASVATSGGLEDVTATAPTFSDEPTPAYTIPMTEGVAYKAGGAPVDAGTYPAAWSESVTITASPKAGYQLEGTTSWEHTFPSKPLIEFEPTGPVFVEGHRDVKGVLVGPQIRFPWDPADIGARYPWESKSDPKSRYDVAWGSTHEITAYAKPGYVLTGETFWSHTFASGVDVIQVTADAPTFDDDALEYTIPSRQTRVNYKRRVNVLAPGKYPAAEGDLVTITATLKDVYSEDYELVGTTVWEHQFPDSGPGPDPDPGEDEDMAEHMPGTRGVARRVMHTLGLDYDDPDDLAMAQESVSAVGYMVKAYTRGIGFTEDKPEQDILSVWITASTRLLANPSGLTYRAGTEWVSDAFKGWTLAEQFTLNNYRKRWN